MLIVRSMMCLVMMICLGVVAVYAQVPSDLQKAMSERQKAIEAADAATWDRLTSDDFTLVNAAGRLSTKAERLAAMKKQKPQASPATRQQEQIKVYGNAAVERVRSGKWWLIQVWVKQDRGWQVVATQTTTTSTK